MHRVIEDLVDQSQSIFVPGRVIYDSRKKISARCMLKIDIKKAYDSVSIMQYLPLIDKMLHQVSNLCWSFTISGVCSLFCSSLFIPSICVAQKGSSAG